MMATLSVGSTSIGRNSFVLEAKQSRWKGGGKAITGQSDLFTPKDPESVTSERGKAGARRAWDVLMINAKRQAEEYARALPPSHGWPPFILVCDVGHCIEIYADFTRQGKNYTQFGVGNDPRYSKSKIFDPFPFPSPGNLLKAQIRSVAEELDAFRKQRQKEYPSLTLTQMYNVLEKLRRRDAGGQVKSRHDDQELEFSAEEERVRDEGLILILKELHDKLDHLVFQAYEWPYTLSGEEILTKLVTLNHLPAAEERRGHVRWLRPDYQISSASRHSRSIPWRRLRLCSPRLRLPAVLQAQPFWQANSARRKILRKQSSMYCRLLPVSAT